MSKIFKKTKNKKGFTLIELLVVLSILAIISLIAVPNFIGVRNKAAEKADDETIRTIESSLELVIVSENGITLPTNTTTPTIAVAETGSVFMTNDKNVKSGAATGILGDKTGVIENYIDTTTIVFQSYSGAYFTVNKNGRVIGTATTN